MKHTPKAQVALTVLMTVLALLTLLPPGYARAQGNSTPTPTPLAVSPTPGGELLVPTSTPETGEQLLIPTNTPSGGLIIPTSTPAPHEPAFPSLSDSQLEAINLQPSDVPADFAANSRTESYTIEDLRAGLQQIGKPELVETMDYISGFYGWQLTVSARYTSCQPNVPVSEIYSDVTQFASPTVARAYFDDPRVQAYYKGLGYDLAPATQMHGWQTSRKLSAVSCFAAETEYWLFTEYWGLLIAVGMTADANTDPQLVWSLVYQLADAVIAHANAQAAQPFPPTPVPAAVILLPTPTPAAEWATLQDIDAAMPTLDDVNLSSPPWELDEEESGISMPEEISYWYRYGGLNDVADAFDSASQRAGMIGRVSRAWYTGGDCSQDWDYLEISVYLFNDSNGPTIFMNDPALQDAWLHTPYNNYDSIEPHTIGNVPGQIWNGVNPYSLCGLRVIHDLVMPHGRFLITVLLIGSPSFESALILFGENFATLTAYRLDRAGLQ